MRPIRRVIVVLNPASGLRREGIAADAVHTALGAAGIAERQIITLRKGVELCAAISAGASKGVDAVVAAGGDGTVSAVAQCLAGGEIPMGVLPSGTLNHFAKDLGIPGELELAARIVAAGHTTSVDVAKVNGRVFINNSSIGLYPTMVATRERWMRDGLPKHVATFAGLLAALWRFPNVSMRLVAGQTGLVTRTPLVFVGNNNYQLSGLTAGTRTSLREGVLQVCTVRARSRATMLRLVTAVLTGDYASQPDLHTATAETARISTLRRRIPVALDGEVIKMRSPLEYSIWPKALPTLVGASD